jgi:hypothetical protein
MTLTRECEEANLTSPGSMPAGFFRPGWEQALYPRVPNRENPGRWRPALRWPPAVGGVVYTLMRVGAHLE